MTRGNASAVPVLLATVAFIMGLWIAPRVFHPSDVLVCFLGWARASGGTRPWALYDLNTHPYCDYPPLVPYLLTLGEWVRRGVGAPEVGALSLTLLKLPSMLACLAAVPLCLRGLRRPFGERNAWIVAVLLATSLPLLFNAAVWGQFDALESVMLLAVFVALLGDRPSLAGGAFGLALATKVLAVAILPAAGSFVLLRFGWRALLRAAAAGALVLGLVAVPYVLEGEGRRVRDAYLNAVDFESVRTLEAYNPWYLLDRFEIAVEGVPREEARSDLRHAFGPVTFRQIGFGAFGLFETALLWRLLRRPTPYVFVLASAMSVFGFFMFPTQIHGRWLIVTVPILALVAALNEATFVLFLGLTTTSLLGEALELGRALADRGLLPLPALLRSPHVYRTVFKDTATLVAVANIILFVAGARLLWRATRSPWSGRLRGPSVGSASL